jgi:hypothetical protein
MLKIVVLENEWESEPEQSGFLDTREFFEQEENDESWLVELISINQVAIKPVTTENTWNVNT